MDKSKCRHKGRIGRRQKTGLMYCGRLKSEVTVVVDERFCHCTSGLCPFSRREIARVEM
jgi:hypothetical protein